MMYWEISVWIHTDKSFTAPSIAPETGINMAKMILLQSADKKIIRGKVFLPKLLFLQQKQVHFGTPAMQKKKVFL